MAGWGKVRTDDIEREVVVPRQTIEPYAAVSALPAALAFIAGEAIFAALAELVPLPEEVREVHADVRLEFENVLLREDVGDDLALARVLHARTRVEEAALDGHERVVEVRLERARAVPVHDLERIRVRDGQVVGRDADERPYGVT